ncbi:MAG: protoporphyrin/coproporphyrin ferrochelatase [Actinomycetota bacterium]|nr:protoporphyrin/coproporphyrin ferrochelatase [Actinomycetota bacterium]
MKHALLLVSFGGPEGPDDVVPFLTNVTRGRGIPPERLEEVGRHYLEVFGGVSPINAQCRELVAALEAAQDRPVYWGNRNWHPLLADTLEQMRADGVTDAYAIVTSAFPSYSGCRQYQEDVARAQVDGLPRVTKLRHYYCEDGFVDAQARNVAAQLDGLDKPRLVFTAHSIPLVMAQTSGPSGGAYVDALRTAAQLVADRVGGPDWDLVFQSRSGPPQVPWLEPDVGDHLESLYAEGVREVVLVPIGFTSDHVEVVYDLDVQAAERAASLGGLTLRRAKTVGTDPEFVRMLVRLVAERATGPELDTHGCIATHDRCPAHCCPPPPPR